MGIESRAALDAAHTDRYGHPEPTEVSIGVVEGPGILISGHVLRDLEDLLFVDRDLAYELLWNFVRTLSRRLRATNDKMTFLATTNKF